MPLEGEITRLRAIERSDAERVYRRINAREVTEHLAIRYPLSTATEEEWVERAAHLHRSGTVTAMATSPQLRGCHGG